MMPTEFDETMPLRSSDDVVRVRQAVRARAVAAGFSLVDQTKIVTAASEIGRNTVDYGGGGTLRIEVLRNGQRRGVRLTFTDKGPGIRDLTQAMKDGYTTGGGLGLGLSGAKRLSNEFDIQSAPGEGTVVTLARWT
jgi:serine/threonine-protein kinase RsbT